MDTTVLIVLWFLNGHVQGLYTPAPVVDTREQCIEIVKTEGHKLIPSEGKVKFFCISENETLEVNDVRFTTVEEKN